jgi:putative nucleotidyltransferase with HDIG domain
MPANPSYYAATISYGRHRAKMVDELSTLVQAIEASDADTRGHAQRVGEYCAVLAHVLGLGHRAGEECRMGGLLHDIGKLDIEAAIVRKPLALSRVEKERIREHPAIGAAIVEVLPFTHPILPFVRSHHERWDGDGYPERLKGFEIPLTARICAVADAFDEMTSSRPYRRRLSRDVALEQLAAGSGKQFDPQCVDAFLEAVRTGFVAPVLAGAT